MELLLLYTLLIEIAWKTIACCYHHASQPPVPCEYTPQNALRSQFSIHVISVLSFTYRACYIYQLYLIKGEHSGIFDHVQGDLRKHELLDQGGIAEFPSTCKYLVYNETQQIGDVNK